MRSRALVRIARRICAPIALAAALPLFGPAIALAVVQPSPGSASAIAVRPGGDSPRHRLLPAAAALLGVAATSSHNAWAVGQHANRRTGLYQALIEHWNGRKWTVAPSPVIGSSSSLQGVAASRFGTWAVGSFVKAGVNQTLIERWNGKKWRRVASPTVTGKFSYLNSVAIVSRTRAWAVGEYFSGGFDQTLIEQWNGTAWKQVTSPSVAGRSSYLHAVAATLLGAWAAGNSVLSATGQTLFEQWTGSTWTLVPSAIFGTSSNFYGAAAVGASVWAVGDDTSSNSTLIGKWNGSTWTHVPSPNQVGATFSFLQAASATSPRSAWAVGGFYKGPEAQTLTERWNGVHWTVVKSPDPGGSSVFNILNAVAATSTVNAWAVGAYRHGATLLTLIEHWNGKAWKHVGSPNP